MSDPCQILQHCRLSVTSMWWAFFSLLLRYYVLVNRLTEAKPNQSVNKSQLTLLLPFPHGSPNRSDPVNLSGQCVILTKFKKKCVHTRKCSEQPEEEENVYFFFPTLVFSLCSFLTHSDTWVTRLTCLKTSLWTHTSTLLLLLLLLLQKGQYKVNTAMYSVDLKIVFRFKPLLFVTSSRVNRCPTTLKRQTVPGCLKKSEFGWRGAGFFFFFFYNVQRV